MKKVTLFIALMLCLASTPLCAQSIETVSLSRPFWNSYVWPNTPIKINWDLKGWSDAEPEESNADWRETKRLEVMSSGFKSTAYWGVPSDPSKAAFLTVATEVKNEDCREILANHVNSYGPPAENDGSIRMNFSEAHWVEFVVKQYDWQIGKTLIQGTCIGSQASPEAENGPSMFVWSTKFSRYGDEKRLSPKIILRCSREIELVGVAGSRRQVDDAIMLIDLNNNRVTNQRNNQLSDNESFETADDFFRFRVTGDDLVTDYLINRITGKLSANARSGGKREISVSGTCTKLDKLERKF